MISGEIIYLRHIDAANICHKGARRWFKDRGWGWTDFLDNGRAAEDFANANCAFADRVVAELKKELDGGV